MINVMHHMVKLLCLFRVNVMPFYGINFVTPCVVIVTPHLGLCQESSFIASTTDQNDLATIP